MALVTQTFSDIITFTRASSATYFDATGTLQTATTDQPRFDYNPSTLAAQGLLIEEARTNLLLQSEDFTTTWTLNTGTITTNATTAPSGATTADELTTNGVNVQVSQGLTISSGATVTGSVFLKQNGLTEVEIVLLSNNNTTPYGRATFNISTGVVSVAASTANGGTNASAAIDNVGNGWYRCSVTVTYPAVTAAGMRVNSAGASGSFYAWGAQLEVGSAVSNSGTASGTTTAVVLSAGSATDDVYNGMVLFVNGEYRTITDYVGSTKTATVAALTASPSGAYVVYSTSGSAAFPTSYIPTTTSAVTRAADVASVNTLSPWYNAAEGTIYAEGGPITAITNKTQLLATINDNTAGNRFYLGKRFSSETEAEFGVSSGGSGQAFIISTPTNITQAKIAAAYKVNDFAFVAGGGVLGTDSSGNLPISPTKLILGALDATSQLSGYIRRITYYPRRLSNAELQAITS